MKYIEKALKTLTYIVLAISIGYFILSVIEFIKLEKAEYTVSKFYTSISNYSGIHKFMLAVLAAYLGLSRLRLSNENNERALNQLRLTESEIFRKREIDTKNETLKQCEFYLTDIQTQFKELIQNEHYIGIPVKWTGLTEITRETLQKKYKASYEKFLASEKEMKSESLLTLYKLEAFSATFLQGNTDLELGKRILGKTFTKQVGFLIGLIAFYQTEGNEDLFANILELKRKWE
jgi:hypothetical protein